MSSSEAIVQSLTSTVEDLGPVPFPPNTKLTRVYMQPFYRDKMLPESMERFRETIAAIMEAGVPPLWSRPLYAMIDERYVFSGQHMRRPGIHIDGNWTGQQWDDMPPRWNAPATPEPPSAPGWSTPPRWSTDVFKPDTMFLASNIEGCLGYSGDYTGVVAPSGAVTLHDKSQLVAVPFEAGHLYRCTGTTLHESLPQRGCRVRALVRIHMSHG